jgi:hypothetical protein
VDGNVITMDQIEMTKKIREEVREREKGETKRVEKH